MSTTAFMGMIIPEVNVTPGPDWATQINNALETVDEHDHSTGKGRKITPSGLNINSNLNFNNYAIAQLDRIAWTAKTSDPTETRAIYVKNSDLYYRDGIGNVVRITSGGALDIASVGGIGGDYSTSGAAVIFSSITDKYTFYDPASDAATLVIGGIDLDPTGSNIISGTPTFSGEALFQQDVTLSQNLDVTGNVGIGGTFIVQGAAEFKNDVTVDQNLDVLSNIIVGFDLTVGDNLTVEGNTQLQGTAEFQSNSTFNDNTIAALKGQVVLGNNVTPSNNIKLHRGGAGILQITEGDDATAQGTLSTDLAKLSFKLEQNATGSLPSASGQEGRPVWDTTTKELKISDGSAYKTIQSSGDLALFSATNWESRTSAANNTWQSVAFGLDTQFVAVSNSGTSNRVMFSLGGNTWATTGSGVLDNNWTSVCFGNGFFVAVSNSGTGTRSMNSFQSNSWTNRSTPADNSWNSVCYGNGLFVAVASSGTGNRVMTSPGGLSLPWTLRSSAADNGWQSVCYGNGLFVAVANSGTGNRVMTSSNGTSWTIRNSAADNSWISVTYGNGLFVAVSTNGANKVMTSPDGITWTLRSGIDANSQLTSVTFGNGLFVAVSGASSDSRIYYSADGITWKTTYAPTGNGAWNSVCFGLGKFVAVSGAGTDIRVMTSLVYNP
jgi:hypothetical protein